MMQGSQEVTPNMNGWAMTQGVFKEYAFSYGKLLFGSAETEGY